MQVTVHHVKDKGRPTVYCPIWLYWNPTPIQLFVPGAIVFDLPRSVSPSALIEGLRSPFYTGAPKNFLRRLACIRGAPSIALRIFRYYHPHRRMQPVCLVRGDYQAPMRALSRAVSGGPSPV